MKSNIWLWTARHNDNDNGYCIYFILFIDVKVKNDLATGQVFDACEKLA